MSIEETLILLDKPEYYLDVAENAIDNYYSTEIIPLKSLHPREEILEIKEQYVLKYNSQNYNIEGDISYNNFHKHHDKNVNDMFNCDWATVRDQALSKLDNNDCYLYWERNTAYISQDSIYLIVGSLPTGLLTRN